jgi:hypothetical protein
MIRKGEKAMRTHTSTGRRTSRRTNSTASKIVSAGLATATCVGLVGVIGIRTAQDSAAADSGSASEATAPIAAAPTTTDGYTQADLDAYAAQLDAEAQRLADYRAQLIDAASTLQQSAGGSSTLSVKNPAAVPSQAQASSAASAKPRVTKPAAQAAPKPQQAPKPQPQSNTKSS